MKNQNIINLRILFNFSNKINMQGREKKELYKNNSKIWFKISFLYSRISQNLPPLSDFNNFFDKIFKFDFRRVLKSILRRILFFENNIIFFLVN